MYKDFNYEKFVNFEDLVNTIQYVVKPGDNLYSIGKKYDVSVNELVNLNKLGSTMIYPNQVLFIPNKMKNDNEYITKDGDTLRGIKEKIGDNLDVDNLKIVSNQVLTLRKGQKKEIVVDGSMNLNHILATYNMTPLEFLKLNEHQFLKPGTKIIVK